MTLLLQQISLALAAIASLLAPVLGAIKNTSIIETSADRVESVKENLKDTTIEIKTDLSLPLEEVGEEVRGKYYTASEYKKIKQVVGAKVRTFKDEPKTSSEEIAIIFDLLNRCGITEINQNMNNIIGTRLENC